MIVHLNQVGYLSYNVIPIIIMVKGILPVNPLLDEEKSGQLR